MHPLQSLLSRRARSQAQTVNGVIDSAVGDGTGDYYVIRADSGDRIRASVSASGVTFAKRTPVLLLRPDDGTVASRSAYIILENRTFTAKGSAFAMPVIDEDHLTGYAVTSLSPSSLTIVGAGTGTVRIHGVGLDSIDPLEITSTSGLGVDSITQTPKYIDYVARLFAGSGVADFMVGRYTFPGYFTFHV